MTTKSVYGGGRKFGPFDLGFSLLSVSRPEKKAGLALKECL
jgi:hypothetical protein